MILKKYMHAIILFNEMKGEWYFYTLFLTLIKILAILMTSNRCNNSNRSILQQNNKKKVTRNQTAPINNLQNFGNKPIFSYRNLSFQELRHNYLKVYS